MEKLRRMPRLWWFYVCAVVVFIPLMVIMGQLFVAGLGGVTVVMLYIVYRETA